VEEFSQNLRLSKENKIENSKYLIFFNNQKFLTNFAVLSGPRLLSHHYTLFSIIKMFKKFSATRPLIILKSLHSLK